MAVGKRILVPVTNPASVMGLMDLAARIAASDGGTVVPVTVVRPESDADGRDMARQVVIEAEECVRQAGGEARGLVIEAPSVAQGVLDAANDRRPTLVLIGWRGRSTTQNVFSEIIDSVVGRSSVPLAVVRLSARPFRRLLLPVSDDHLVPAGASGVALAAALTSRLRQAGGLPVRVLRTGAGSGNIPDDLRALSDRVHHDPRRYHVAVGAAAEAADLVVVPVAPTVSGLRSATTHVAWNLPDSSLLVALDVGPQAETRSPRLGAPAPAVPAPPAVDQLVAVTVRLPVGEQAHPPGLAKALGPLGAVSDVSVWQDDDQRACMQAEVRVPPNTEGGAIAAAMRALHEAPGLAGAELRYELQEPPGS